MPSGAPRRPFLFDVEIWALFWGSFLASTLLPGGSEALLTALYLKSDWSGGMLWLVASVGNTLGGLLTFGMGRWFQVGVGVRESRHRFYVRAQRWLRRWGGPALLLSWVPLVGDPLCLAAGWSRLPWLSALIWIFLGKAIRYGVLLVGLHMAA
ncbi:MAG: DedA family protein [Chromatiales bacterium]|nr:DedA family protein [Chromatiales bacterium]